MNMDIIRAHAALVARKLQLDDDLREVNRKIAETEPEVRTEMLDHQIDKLPITVDGESITLHFRTELWAKPIDGDKAAVVKVLKTCGLGDYVSETYNTSSLSAYVRDRLGDDLPLQPTLASVLKLDEVTKVRGRRSPAAHDSKTAKAMRTLNKQPK